MIFNGKVIQIIGYVATAAGIGASIVSGWVESKKTDQKIAEKVKEEVAKHIKVKGA